MWCFVQGHCECPFDFYKTWVNSPEKAQQNVEEITRPTIGVPGCPVYDLPSSSQANGLNGHTESNKKRKT